MQRKTFFTWNMRHCAFSIWIPCFEFSFQKALLITFNFCNLIGNLITAYIRAGYLLFVDYSQVITFYIKVLES